MLAEQQGAPAGSRLDAYPADAGAGDLFRGAADGVIAKWHQVANGLAGHDHSAVFLALERRKPLT